MNEDQNNTPKRPPIGTQVKHAEYGKGKIFSYQNCDEFECRVEFPKKGRWCIDLRELTVLTNDKATVKQSLTVENQQRIESTDLFAVEHLVFLHRVLYGTIDKADALKYLHSHLREDADLADMGRPLRYQYQANAKVVAAPPEPQ